MHRASLLAALAAVALAASASPSPSYHHEHQGTCKDAYYAGSKDAYKRSPLGAPHYDAYKGDRDASILQLLRADRRFSKLVTALSRAGGSLRDDLDDPNSKHKITLLSPTDEAFEVLERMHGKTVETMDQGLLQKILQYHVIESGRGDDEERFYGHGKAVPEYFKAGDYYKGESYSKGDKKAEYFAKQEAEYFAKQEAEYFAKQEEADYYAKEGKPYYSKDGERFYYKDGAKDLYSSTKSGKPYSYTKGGKPYYSYTKGGKPHYSYNYGKAYYNGGGGLRKEDLCDGETLETALIEKRLGDSHEVGNRQRVRVTKYSGKVILNMYSMVIDSDMEAANGIVHALADVLILPEQLFSGISSLPNMFSTQALALKLTGLDKRVNEERGVTALVPSNSAYESMGFFQTMEMFHPANRDELKKFLEKHYISEPLYVNEIIEDEYAKTRSRAAATCLAAKRGDHAYFERLRRAKYYAGNNNNNNNGSGDDEDVIEREYETWAGDKVVLRVECSEGGIDVLFDNTVVALADVPSANGVVQILTQPIENHTNNKRDDDDDDEGRKLASYKQYKDGYFYGAEGYEFDSFKGDKYAAGSEYEIFNNKHNGNKHGRRNNHRGHGHGKRRPNFYAESESASRFSYGKGGKPFGSQQAFFFPGAFF